MEIQTFVTGPVQTNLYVVSEGTDAVIIDPAMYSDEVMNYITALGLNVRAILLTHAHFDHSLGLADYLDCFDVPAYLGEKDADMLYCPEKDASEALGVRYRTDSKPEITEVKEGDVINAGKLSFRVIETPGHTKGSVSYYAESEGCVFSGDTLFFMGAGRTDLYSGDPDELCDSIFNKLYALPDSTLVYCGHMRRTAIGFEKENNYSFSIK